MGEMQKAKVSVLYILNNFEVIIGAVLFTFIMILLFAQVVSRYVFLHSITWAEELATMMFLWMIYCGVAGAVSRRKHLSIDFFINLLPFKVKKGLLLFDNLVSIVFCGYMVGPMFEIVTNLRNNGAVTAILRMNRAALYTVVPLMMILTIIRFVQESLVLLKEKETNLGTAKPTLNISAYEMAYALKKKRETELSSADITHEGGKENGR